ncbi:MAG: hypothetical protein K2L13_00600, partial [Opitutales bacterium]|nr:hypothetical protein [Opitutales bacterium]
MKSTTSTTYDERSYNGNYPQNEQQFSNVTPKNEAFFDLSDDDENDGVDFSNLGKRDASIFQEENRKL